MSQHSSINSNNLHKLSQDPIEQNAWRLLGIMIKNGREFDNQELQQLSEMEDYHDVDDAIEWLAERGAVDVEWEEGSIDTNFKIGLVTLKGRGKSLYNGYLTLHSAEVPVINQHFYGSIGNVAVGSQAFEQNATLQSDLPLAQEKREPDKISQGRTINKLTWNERVGQVARQHVTLEKKDGVTIRSSIWAYIVRDPDEIIITYNDVQMPIEVGDIILRSSPAGQERLTVIDEGYHIRFKPEMLDGYPEHYAIRYTREASERMKLG